MRLKIEVSVELDAPEFTEPGRLDQERCLSEIRRVVRQTCPRLVRQFNRSWSVLALTDFQGAAKNGGMGRISNLDLLA